MDAVLLEPPASPVAPILLIGCGNLLRGDDAVGPLLIRELWQTWGERVPPEVEICDGGTAGMDVAFKMRGRRRVILFDASRTGHAPGTLFCVPGTEVENLPEPTGMHSHSFRWDHALAFARWLLKDAYPEEIQVYLIEAGQLGFGEPLTEAVRKTMHGLVAQIAREFTPGQPVPAVAAA